MMTLTGVVEKKRTAPGSKSDRNAVLIKTRYGYYILRRQQGNPFVDPVLNRLVGKRVRFEGNVAGSTFLISRFNVLKGSVANQPPEHI